MFKKHNLMMLLVKLSSNSNRTNDSEFRVNLEPESVGLDDSELVCMFDLPNPISGRSYYAIPDWHPLSRILCLYRVPNLNFYWLNIIKNMNCIK